MHVYYSPAYTAAGHAFDTTRKARWIADSLMRSPIPGLELVEPAPLTRDQVQAVHEPRYVGAIETGEPRLLAESQGFRWDPGLWPMVLASNGGVVSAALAALEDGVSGSLSSGLHHARRERGSGFCTFNGLVIAARAALAAGARSVLILDLDAHCGGGTASLIAGDPRIWQVGVSVNSFDNFSNTNRAVQKQVSTGSEYVATIERTLREARQQKPAFDLCIYNAGMDPMEDCSTGGLAGVTRQTLEHREAMVFDWCSSLNVPVAFTLAGGYIGPRLDEQGLVSLHRLTLSAASRTFDRGVSR